MDPRTFLPAGRVTVHTPPRPGEPARELENVAWTAPTVLTFLRHVGCPFAEATFRDLRAHAEVSHAVRFLAVSHASSQATATWCEAVAGGPGRVTILLDPTRTLYGKWGLGQSSLWHFLGPQSLTGAVRLAREGIRNRHPVGTRWQKAGTFGIDADGRVRFAHLPAHAGDLPDFERVLAALERGPAEAT